MDIKDKQYLAKILFTSQKLDQKVVAQKVGISENTMSKWVNDFRWKDLRNRLLVGKEEMLNDFYEELAELNETIRGREKGKRYSNNKEADTKVKLTAAIRNLETELAIADLVASGKKFLKFMQMKNLHDQVNEYAEIWNDFIHAEMRK